MKTNAFGDRLPEIKSLLKDTAVEKRIRKTLLSVLAFLEIESPEQVVEFSLLQAKKCRKLSDYERSVHRLLDEKRVTQRIPIKLSNRAQTIFSQISPFVKGHQVLDLGCGDGKVGELVSKQGRAVILADVYEHGNVSNLNLPFVIIRPGKRLPFDDNTFDTTLLLTVLHHADNPKHVIAEARRVTKKGGRIIVLESVHGVREYGSRLASEQQRLVNIFFDHFYNRVIHYSEHPKNKVNVPFNFQTPQEWKKLFSKSGLAQEKMLLLGFDQPTVPEYHTLHILRVK